MAREPRVAAGLREGAAAVVEQDLDPLPGEHDHITDPGADAVARAAEPVVGNGLFSGDHELYGASQLVGSRYPIRLHTIEVENSPGTGWDLLQRATQVPFEHHRPLRQQRCLAVVSDNDEGTTDVEAAAHGLVSFETGQVCSFQISWAEMIKREEVSVVFQGTKSGGKVERLFGEDGLDETAIDTCEIYSQNGAQRVDTTIEVEECEDMGRIKSAANFILAIEGTEEPLNTPEQALTLMRVIDAAYQSAASGAPVSCQ